MIFVERSEAAPASLSSPAALAEAEATEAHYEHWHPGDAAYSGFTHYRGHDVHESLKRIFRRKCAYCETVLEKAQFEVEHYRPKAGVAGCDHPGYWWLALTWSNMLPTCAPCNKGLYQHIVTADMTLDEVMAMRAKPASTSHGKATQFPVAKARLQAKADDHFAEDPLLLDPTRSDPAPHLKWRDDATFSVVEPADMGGGLSRQGETTIACVALNRVDLVQNRTELLNLLRVQRIQIIDDFERDMDSAADPALQAAYLTGALRRIDDMAHLADPGQPYSAMAAAFIAAFRAEFIGWAEA